MRAAAEGAAGSDSDVDGVEIAEERIEAASWLLGAAASEGARGASPSAISCGSVAVAAPLPHLTAPTPLMLLLLLLLLPLLPAAKPLMRHESRLGS